MPARAFPAWTRPPWIALAALTLLWALLYLPNAGLPSLYYEEGRHALAAKAMLDAGNWLRPTVLGQAFIDKPPLLFWLIAGLGALFGGIGEWAVRWPSLLAVLATALAIAAWLKGRVRPEVAVLGGAAFLLNPTIMEKAALGEPDTLVTAFSAIAYLLWLDGRHRPTLARFAAVAALLALAAMTKQAVMLGFFAGAAILVLALERARPAAWIALGAAILLALVPWAMWAASIRQPGDATQLAYALRLYGPPPGYALAQLSMLGEFLAETLPWSLIALPALIPPWRRRLGIDAALARPAAAYALACPAVLALWPSAVPRYLMPALPGLVICAALTLESLWLRRWVRRLVLGVVLLLVLAQLGLRLVAVPFYLPSTRASAEAAAEIERIVATAPDRPQGPLVVAGLHGFHNAAWYLRPHPRHLRLDELPGPVRPAWVLTGPASLAAVTKAWPGATPALANKWHAMILLKIPPP